ncbi:potassium voltage-gated channel subfamily S member 3-like [Oncorhynchus keta]|uniref:potassium voltage-gated channel subfamily S member 3-like n=1 Tax=Oncorhynchus keta TaxID=8018 RepID=UPI0015FD7761|nr:potassium voltage-gated channel subfamily S member 3-like [Oncorhynchus keta]XP_035650471.1 potassium voltage-gated channel subfamily S member 3-like [Oncorhynchus keta]XP_035650472.1 potassium voltage-gated channel subfamily S member 3-like [Oncorhynchus keta]XP_035650473.1 potassium voltage-gated channel subfamily S member 3-like [Oncorhynchus keta]XP_035650474.1 potassium voltage-gated channel subfamily S member 3-like [Oncorhynchus keta]XP_035650476.1 potassium voltage-gated channel sub
MGYGQVLHRCGNEEDQVYLNVGGVRHEVAEETLLRFPHTRLGRLLHCRSEDAILELCDDYSATEREYYFDRNPHIFISVINFYRTGRIHIMEEVCVFSFSQEIEYWGIQELHLGDCCSNWFQERKEYIEDRDWDIQSDDVQPPSLDSSFEELSAMDKDLEKFKGAWCAEVRSYVWIRLEDPGHSLSSKIIAVASLSVVLTSIVAMCVHSMPEFQILDENERHIEDPVLAILEVVCIVCFSAEFIIRLIVAPSPRKFLSNTLNIIDVASILPFYITLAFETVDDENSEENENLENVGKVVQVLRLMRVFRILKLARHSVGLRALGATVRHSYHEVGLLLLFLSVGISIFSVLIYSAEKEEEDTELGTIPMGWWWATITMTTVGYGDTCPVTLLGKLVATLCILCGLLVVALPITIIFNKFSKYYQRNKAIEEGLCLSQKASERHDLELPYHNIRDLYAQSLGVYPFMGGLAFKNSESSGGDDTDASSLQDIEEVCDTDTLDNGAGK